MPAGSKQTSDQGCVWTSAPEGTRAWACHKLMVAWNFLWKANLGSAPQWLRQTLGTSSLALGLLTLRVTTSCRITYSRDQSAFFAAGFILKPLQELGMTCKMTAMNKKQGKSPTSCRPDDLLNVLTLPGGFRRAFRMIWHTLFSWAIGDFCQPIFHGQCQDSNSVCLLELPKGSNQKPKQRIGRLFMGIEHMLYRQKSMVRYQALHTPTHYHNPQNRAGEIAQDSGQLLHMLDHSLIWKPHHSLRPTIYSPENSCTQHHWVWARRSLVQSNNTFPGPCIESYGCVGLELLGVYKISRIVKIILRKMKRY